MPSQRTSGHASGRLFIGLSLCMLLLGTAEARGEEQAQATNEPVRGDLPPGSAEWTTLLESDLSSREAKALFRQMRDLLLTRLDSDFVTEQELYLGAMQGMLDVVNRQAGDPTA
ncbi:MAG TPA: hypothetical protein DIU15_13290, partial [Deltaproteobacteria bacterium]|nr:hypothetical protein [Deltaproteobacteria bacterium]